MDFVKEYVFNNINVEDIDEIIGKSSSERSYRYIHSYKPLRLIFNVKIIDEEDNKTKTKYLKIMATLII